VRRVPAEGLLFGTVLLWSFNFTAIRYGITHGFQPLAYAPLRWGLAGIALAVVARSRGQSLLVGRRDLAVLAGASVIGVLVNQIAFVYAVHLVSASTVALVFGTLPIFVSLVSTLSGLERLRLRHWVATGVSFLGVSLVAAGASGGLSASATGIALALVTTGTFAVYSVLVVPVMRRHSPIVVNAISSLAGAAMLAVASSTVLAREDWSGIGSLGWGALLYSALISIALGNVFWFTAIDRVGPGRASLFANLQPFLGALFAVLVLSESLSGGEIAGGVVIAGGILLGRHARPMVAAPSE
jgi:drug/metabolite transporter (DMT)-like permease